MAQDPADRPDNPLLVALDMLPIERPLTTEERARLAQVEADFLAGNFSPGEEVTLRVALRVLREEVVPALDALDRRRLWPVPSQAIQLAGEQAGPGDHVGSA